MAKFRKPVARPQPPMGDRRTKRQRTRAAQEQTAIDFGFLSLPPEVQDEVNAYAAKKYAEEKDG